MKVILSLHTTYRQFCTLFSMFCWGVSANGTIENSKLDGSGMNGFAYFSYKYIWVQDYSICTKVLDAYAFKMSENSLQCDISIQCLGLQ